MLIDDFFKANSLPLEGKTLVVATSGGPDSMALLDMVNEAKVQYHFKLIAAHFNHQLRVDSNCEDTAISSYCQTKQIEVVTGKWSKQLQPQKGIEAAARQVRYQFLTEVMKNMAGDYLLTAHHSDDLLENILLKFIRSGNPSEMNSLQPVSRMNDQILLRPLLTVEKTELLTYVEKRQIPFVIDQTNNEDDALRNRIRHRIVPLLKAENPEIKRSAWRFSKQMNLMTSLIAGDFEQIEQPSKYLGVFYRLKKENLASLTEKQKMLYWQNFIWKTWHVRVNDNLGNFELLSYQDYFYLIEKPLPDIEQKQQVELGQKFNFGTREFVITDKLNANDNLIAKLNISEGAKIYAGPLESGAKLNLKNGQHVKSKKKFAQSGIPNVLRPYCLAIFADSEVVFIEDTYSSQRKVENKRQFYLYGNI